MSFYLIECPKGPLRMYWRSLALREGTPFLWQRCQDQFQMERP